MAVGNVGMTCACYCLLLRRWTQKRRALGAEAAPFATVTMTTRRPGDARVATPVAAAAVAAGAVVEAAG